MDDWFVYKDGTTMHPHVFRTALGQIKNVVEYQVLQTANGAHIKVILHRSDNFAAMEGRVADQLDRSVLPKPVVKIEKIPLIERTGSATKLKRFIALP